MSSNITLNDGHQMPSMGINTWNIDFDDTNFIIKAAIKAGFKVIDTSVLNYNEQQIGNTLKAMVDSGQLKRKDVYVITKLPPTANNPESVEPAIVQSLQSLKLDYVDLYLIQVPIGLVPDERFDAIKFNKDGTVCLDNTTDHIKVWKKMEDLVLKGLTKSIGLSNFNRSQIAKIIPHCTIVPAVLQIEYHIYLQQPSLIEFCQDQHIAILSYAPLGVHDMLVASSFSRTKRDFPNLTDDPQVQNIAKKYKITASQVLVRWILDKGFAFVLRMSNLSRMNEIHEVRKISLKEEDIAILNRLDRGFRYIEFAFINGAHLHPEYPF